MITKRWNIVFVFGVFLFALSGLAARAQIDDSAIQFPIAELGGCGSKEECKAYCDKPGNMETCVAFAEKNNLMPQEEIQMAKKFIAAGAKGPGGCTGKESCETYCNDINNIDACVSFAEENGMMSGSELAEAKKVQAAIKRGVTPPPCGGKQACDSYCRKPENMAACLTFAKEADLMSEAEMKDAEKMLAAIQAGVKPPACGSKEECDVYCSQEENINECIEFGRAAGFMTEQEYEMAKKTGGKGPGGCRGKEECESFCQNPENQETCFSFAKETGLISEEEIQKMEEGKRQFRESISKAPPEVTACLKEKLGEEKAAQILSGGAQPSQEVGETMRTCFEQAMRQQASQMQGGPEGQMGPNGPMPPQGMPEGYQGQMPPEGYRGQMPPEGYQGMRPPEGGQMPPEVQREYEKKYQEEYQRQMQNYQGQMPPEGAQMPPGGYQGQMPPEASRMPPEGYQMPPQGIAPSGEGGIAPAGSMTAPAPTTTSEPAPAPSPAPAPTDSGGTAPTVEAAPAPAPAPAPTAEVAPAPAPAPADAPAPTTSLVSPNSLMAAAINFFKALLVR